MQPGREINRLPPSGTDVMNGWSYTCTPLLCAFMALKGTNLHRHLNIQRYEHGNVLYVIQYAVLDVLIQAQVLLVTPHVVGFYVHVPWPLNWCSISLEKVRGVISVADY
jgi:hypothetical protein